MLNHCVQLGGDIISKTVPVYFGDDEEHLLELIDKERKYISRSSWFKMAAENYLFGSSRPKERAIEPTIESDLSMDGIDNFLDSF